MYTKCNMLVLLLTHRERYLDDVDSFSCCLSGTDGLFNWCLLLHVGGQRQPPYGTSWVPVALGILTALVTAVALALILLRKRRKETRFG